MDIIPSEKFEKNFKALTKQKPELAKQFDAEIQFFLEDRYHESFQLHGLKRDQKLHFSIKLEEDLIVIFRFIKDGILLIDIGNHDEVY